MLAARDRAAGSAARAALLKPESTETVATSTPSVAAATPSVAAATPAVSAPSPVAAAPAAPVVAAKPSAPAPAAATDEGGCRTPWFQYVLLMWCTHRRR